MSNHVQAVSAPTTAPRFSAPAANEPAAAPGNAPPAANAAAHAALSPDAFTAAELATTQPATSTEPTTKADLKVMRAEMRLLAAQLALANARVERLMERLANLEGVPADLAAEADALATETDALSTTETAPQPSTGSALADILTAATSDAPIAQPGEAPGAPGTDVPSGDAPATTSLPSAMANAPAATSFPAPGQSAPGFPAPFANQAFDAPAGFAPEQVPADAAAQVPAGTLPPPGYLPVSGPGNTASNFLTPDAAAPQAPSIAISTPPADATAYGQAPTAFPPISNVPAA